MGNRAVISLGKTHSPNNIGIYLHWNGGRDSVESFLAATREHMGGRLGDETYGAARLVQCISTFIHGNLSLGIGLCKELDCDNFDNGVYVVDPATMEIVGREFFGSDREEQNGYDQEEFKQTILDAVNASAIAIECPKFDLETFKNSVKAA